MPDTSQMPRVVVGSVVAHVLSAQEGERKRLAWELHENIAQTIVATKIKAEIALAALDSPDRDAIEGSLREMLPLLQGTLDEARRLCAELRPTMLDDLGLAPTVSWFCRAFRAAHPEVELKLSLWGLTPDMADPIKIAVYRVLEEAVYSTARSTRATRILVMLRQREQRIDLIVVGNGCGFDFRAVAGRYGGLGLAAMKEWVESFSGSLRVDSTRHAGVRVRASWPLPLGCGRPRAERVRSSVVRL